MLKKIVLILTFFGLACAAFLASVWLDNSPTVPTARSSGQSGPRVNLLQTRPSSQPTGTFAYRGAEIQPGDGFMIRVFNPDGEARIVFQATKCNPLSDTEFHVTQPTARVLLPGGQLAYVRADEGHIVVQRDDRNNYNPKRGKLVGNVQLSIDRTKPEWRKANPELAEPEDHPDAITKVWMDDVSFDLDLARLHTDGPLLVQSVDATIEGRGLTLVWNEANRRIKLLRIAEGKRAIVQMKSLMHLGIGGAQKDAEAAVLAAQEVDIETALADRPVVLEDEPVAADEEADSAGDGERIPTITLADLEDTEEPLDKDRIDTYRIVFRGGIVAEQRQGLRVVGRMKAELLEMLRDFGSQERSAVEHAPTAAGRKSAAGRGEKRATPNPAVGGRSVAGPIAAKPVPHDAPTAAPPSAAGGMVKADSTLVLRWSGELVVTPVEATETQPATGSRFHLIAEGNPLQLHDRESGDATCRRLEYRDETQEVWLFGDAERLVTLQADADRQLAGERIFLDRKNGIARVEGPGRMTDARTTQEREAQDECIRNELAKLARQHGAAKKTEHDRDGITITWKHGVEVHFAPLESSQTQGFGKTPGIAGGKEYLKSAVFRGEVSFDQPGQSMAADRIDIVFAPPKAEPVEGEHGVAAESLLAQGNVRMANDESVITCDRLEVEMTTDDTGRNVPRIGKASGNVVARQGKQEIRASDQMIVTLESLPKPVDPQERERLATAAQACGYTPESEAWKAIEQKLESRRRIIVRTLNARGDIAVRDADEQVDVGADVLDCAFDDDQQISRALVMGSKESPAHVAMSDFYIRGPQVNFRLSDQTAEVPDEGVLRFFTKQDFSGRRVDEPVPVVITWREGMSFRGQQNIGRFSGAVRAVSEGTILDCRELTLRFENVPEDKTASRPAEEGPDSRWIAGKVIDLIRDRDKGESSASAASISKGIRKRLIHIHAIGDAVVASSEYAKPARQFGPFSGIMAAIMPDALQPQAQEPSREDQKLLSFVRINGPRITVDLNNEHMVVEGAGNLLVLDYRMPEGRPTATPPQSGLAPAAVGSLRSSGPSQTVFTWQNSMSYLNRRCVAVLDNRVIMKHVAGSEVAMPDQVAAAMKIDPRSLASLKSRRAELTCENLVVEFARNRNRDSQESSSLSSATELKSFQASHRVRMQENNRAVEGELVTYDSGTGLIRIQGSPQLPAWAADIDEKTGAVPGSWRGQELEWNLNTGVVRVTGASITAQGR